MTVAATTRKAGPFVGNGVTTVFPFAFKVFSKTDLQVIRTDNSTGNPVTLVLDSDYSVTLNPDQDSNPGGSITYPILVGPTPLPATATLTMIGDLAYAQPTDITNTSRFLPQVIENALDRVTILTQQLKEIASRSLQAAVGTTVALVFPAPSSGKFIKWRSDLTGLENADAGTDSMVLQGLLADAADVNHGTAMIGYKPAGSGSVGRTLSAKLNEQVSVKDFGALGNGVANDTVALQAAINYCVATGAPLFIPNGTYRHTTLTVSGAITIIGGCRFTTALQYMNATGNAIEVDCVGAFKVTGITFACGVTRTSGSCITLTSTPAGTVNQNSIFRDCTFNSQVDCIHTVKAMTWIIDNCQFAMYTGSAVHVQNDDNGDGGDSTIHGGCVFNGDPTSINSIGVFQVSSGGLKIINNKFVSGSYGYLMRLGHNVLTGDLLMTGNSIENMKTAGIQLNRAAGVLDMSFSNVTIVGNQFLGTATGIPINLNDADAGWLLGVTIAANQVDISHAGASQYGIFVNSANAFTISGNCIIGAAPSIAINIGAAAVGGTVGPNTMAGFTTGIANASPSTSVAKKSVQGTTAAITCSGALGAVFTGSAGITFPAGFFASTPRVMATVNGGANGIGATAISASAGGATIQAMAATTGANVTVAWRAEADY